MTNKMEQEQYRDDSDGDSSGVGGSSMEGSSLVDQSTASRETDTHGGAKTDTSSSSDGISREGRAAVTRSKILVLLVLAVAAAAVGWATYRTTFDSEQNEFEKQFHVYALELEGLVQAEAKSIFLTMENLANTITSYALDEESDWPMVTVPHFEMRGMTANKLSLALMVALSPIVPLLDREAWENYAVANQDWIQEGLDWDPDFRQAYTSVEGYELTNISDSIWHYGPNLEQIPERGRGPYMPVWQMAPAPHDSSIVNYNLLDYAVFEKAHNGVMETGLPVLSGLTDLEWLYGGAVQDNHLNPHSFLLYPIHQTFPQELESETQANPIVATTTAVLPWDNYFSNLMPSEAEGLIVVIRDTCDDVFTYRIDGRTATFLGLGDLHDAQYTYLEESADFVGFLQYNFSRTQSHCEYFLYIYPSSTLHEKYLTAKPVMYTTIVVAVFFLTTMVFVLYDFFVQQRNDRVVAKAKKSNAIVSALFPKNVRDRIMQEAEEQVEAEMAQKAFKKKFGVAAKSQLKTFLSDGAAANVGPQNQQQGQNGLIKGGDGGGAIAFAGKPIADLFPSATVMFADIAGFTAWSSVREPTQVFQLLETLYNAFDEIAGRRRVFKVETIGDCYVAVAGLPEPRKDHAVVMARFSRDCQSRMNDLTKLLEVSLGPDTGDLAVRIGLHSGPVTAGVLRGEKARFQLFGDTVNTAARMESNGIRNKIHISNDTADHLRQAGKQHWLVAREEKIVAKGKGEMETFFLEIKVQSSASNTSKSTTTSHSENDGGSGEKTDGPLGLNDKLGRTSGPSKHKLSAKATRLCKWNVEILGRLLKQVVARRNELQKRNNEHTFASKEFKVETTRGSGGTVIDEVKEIIELPEYDAEIAQGQEDASSITLSPQVEQQLFEYIALIASMYRDVPFHNFEHASHVTMSVTKLLSRIVAPDDVLSGVTGDGNGTEDHIVDKNLHDHTFGITSDPLTQFAVVMSALIHDVDHVGVPNAQLVKEGAEVASIYKNKSVAEQNSIDIAWELLMDPSFEDLRHTIYGNSEEKKRFRQLLVNVVLATDIVDKELKELRNGRWDKAFHSGASKKDLMSHDEINRKATIVLEHIIQASDISHTMQHWHVYRKWNERFFDENMVAYKAGRMDKDPSEFWYKGEIGFFDFYIIPLAKKLKECGVFGVSSDEYLNYAKQNRREWEMRGEEVVAEMMKKYQ